MCAFLIYRYGLPEPTGYTACPMAFFYAGFIMIATGGMLGLSLATTESRLFHWRLLACLTLATLFLGEQSYGIWCLAHIPQRPDSSMNAVAMMMAIFHCASTLAISLLIAYASAHTTPAQPPAESKSILKICAIYWYGLGFTWTFLLCLFSLI